MLLFPNAKINIGLNVVEKRNDGFHNIETVFYPVNFYDCLEVIENQNLKDDFTLFNYGLKIDCDINKNLIIKALQLMKMDFYLPKIEIHLQKNVNFGAGLGGGSSDAAFMLKLVNKKFNLNLPNEKLLEYAKQLGSDCAFFIENKAVFASGRGDTFEEINLNLNFFKMLLVLPNINVSTKEAYADINPRKSNFNLRNLSLGDVYEWKNYVKNDFEIPVFTKFTLLAKLKDALYNNFAVYASMSGSGSALFGFFQNLNNIDIAKIETEINEILPNTKCFWT